MSPTELARYHREIALGMRRNLAIFLLVEAVWGLGFAFVSISAIVPYYLKQAGASDQVIGALPAVWVTSITAIQLWVAHLTWRLRVKKVVFTVIHYPGSLAVAALGVVALHSQRLGSGRTLVLSLVCMAVFGVSLGFATPMWTNLLAKLFPHGSRGKLFSYVFMVASLAGIGGAELARRTLAHWPFPQNFAVGFIVSGVILSASVTAFLWLREPALPEVASGVRFGRFVRELWAATGERRGFRALLVVRCAVSLGTMAGVFYAVAARGRFSLGDESAAVFTMIGLAAQLVSSPLVGVIGDRCGFRFLAPVGPFLAALASLVALLAPSPAAFCLVFVLAGMSWPTDFVAMTNLAIEYCPHMDKTAFLALTGTVVAPFAAAAPLAGGWIAEHAAGEYATVFVAAIVLNVIAAIMAVFLVREPRPGGET